MKRWLVGALLVALAGVLVVVVIDSNRDPIAVLEEFGAKIKRNEQGEVQEVEVSKITDLLWRKRVEPQARDVIVDIVKDFAQGVAIEESLGGEHQGGADGARLTSMN